MTTDGIPSSGMTIPPQRRMELIGLQSGGGGDSEEEMSESISELPSFGGQKTSRKRIQMPKSSEEVYCLFRYNPNSTILEIIAFLNIFRRRFPQFLGLKLL